MKKIFSLFVAAFAAVSLFAGEYTVDLNSAQGYAQYGSGVPTVTDGVLNVAWDVTSGWSVAGVEFVLPDLTGVEKITFDYKAGDAAGVDMLVYLVNAEGGLRWDGEVGGLSLGAAEWTSVALVPTADLWGNHGEEPWGKLVFVANPAEPTSGVFSIRDLKIECDYEAPVVAKPETAPAAPTHAVGDVMAMYCNHYETNNLHFETLGWGDTQWEDLEIEGTVVRYTEGLIWEMMTNWSAASYDFSAYSKFHFDVWVPEARNLRVTFEALKPADGGRAEWKQGINFRLNAGWNTIDCDPAWWITEEAPYDWTDVKYIAFEGFKNVDGETIEECSSAEGTPFAFTNLYWWKAPAVEYPEAPALPTRNEEGVMALFCPAYTTNNVNFEPQAWGCTWNNVDGKFFYAGAMTWDAMTNWGADHYDMSAYDMFACDIYVTVASNIKITFEALGAGDGGTGWKNGALVEGLEANKWNHIEIDLLNEPYSTYEFTDVRYLILEAFTNEGTPLGIANAYFFDSTKGVDNVNADKNVVKRIENGQLIIEKKGVKYNVLGTQL